MHGLRSRARTIELVGEYDLTQKAEVASLFGALAPDGPAVIDMARVTYVDSSFIHELLSLRKRFKLQPITLLVGNAHVRHVLRLMNLELQFEIRNV